MTFVAINMTSEQIERASSLYSFGALKNSVTKGEGNVVGALGEIAVFDYFSQRAKVVFDSTRDFDMIINGFKIDVKTSRSNFDALAHYHFIFFDVNTTQNCDFYFFVHYNITTDVAFLVGYLKPSRFYELATFHRKGERRHTVGNFLEDTFSVCYNKLNQFKK
jgi:hypothetical protein